MSAPKTENPVGEQFSWVLDLLARGFEPDLDDTGNHFAVSFLFVGLLALRRGKPQRRR
jgi:hypothetical protein